MAWVENRDGWLRVSSGSSLALRYQSDPGSAIFHDMDLIRGESRDKKDSDLTRSGSLPCAVVSRAESWLCQRRKGTSR